MTTLSLGHMTIRILFFKSRYRSSCLRMVVTISYRSTCPIRRGKLQQNVTLSSIKCSFSWLCLVNFPDIFHAKVLMNKSVFTSSHEGKWIYIYGFSNKININCSFKTNTMTNFNFINKQRNHESYLSPSLSSQWISHCWKPISLASMLYISVSSFKQRLTVRVKWTSDKLGFFWLSIFSPRQLKQRISRETERNFTVNKSPQLSRRPSLFSDQSPGVLVCPVCSHWLA